MLNIDVKLVFRYNVYIFHFIILPEGGKIENETQVQIDKESNPRGKAC